MTATLPPSHPKLAALLCCLGLLLSACGEEIPNRSPSITSAPPGSAPAYQTYLWSLACADPDGDLVTITLGEGDTCGGELTDHGNRTATYSFFANPDLGLDACSVQVVCDDGELTDVETATVALEPPPEATDLTFDGFEPWAEPIADYITEAATALHTWSFAKAIFDLAVYDHRLYIGYGDATLNAGSLVPIEIRAWREPEPDAIQTEYVTGEEQIDRYRQMGGRLLIPGVDATEDGLLGQVYSLDATGWTMDRTVPWAWHVQDVALQGDDLVACGSGGTIDDYNDGTVNAYLYRRTPDATGFVVEEAIAHPQPPGDNRLTKLLVVGSTLYATGYWSDYTVSYATAYRLGDGGLEPWDDMAGFFVTDTLSLTADLGLVFGVAIEATLRWAARVVTPTGVADALGLMGLTVIDADPLPGGRALILAREGDSYPAADEGPFDVLVGVTSDGQDFIELLRQTFDVAPRSVAYWRDSLYLGRYDGSVWRARGNR